MEAFHTNWTAPFFARNPKAAYSIEAFELLTTILSALEWQALGNSIRMITDDIGAAYYHTIGLDKLWNDGIHPLLTNAVPPEISPEIFWAGGKLFALQQMPAPCVMLDTDFIIWKDIAPLCGGADIAVIHREDINPEIYPDKPHFHLTPGFDMDSLDWTVKPCNTALCYFAQEEKKQAYTTLAIDFMRHASGAGNTLTYMVFAEQRLLAMYAAKNNAKLVSFFDLTQLFSGNQQYFTHVWGYKQHLRQQPEAYAAFCRRCACRIARDFPTFAKAVSAVPNLSIYFQ